MNDGTRSAQIVDEVYRELRRAILEGRYLPAQHLVEQSLADEFRTSKTPVREALARLKEDGLVESIPYRGYFIKTISSDDLAEIYELRELYEGACVRAAAQGEDHEAVAEQLTKANAAASRGFSDGDIQAVHSSFARFDEILYAQTPNRRLTEQIERLRIILHLAGALTNQIPGRIQKSILQHDEIISAVAAGQPTEAEELMRSHIRSLLEEELSRRDNSLAFWSVS